MTKRAFRLPFSPARASADAAEELRFHVEGRIEEFVARGMTREEAEREALRLFGDVRRVEAEVNQIDYMTHARRAWRDRLDDAMRDVRYAARSLIRRPGFTCAVILTLGIAVGASTAVFSVFETVLLKPVAAAHLKRLFVVLDDFPASGLRNTTISPMEALDLYARTDIFETASTVNAESAIADIGGTATQVVGATTTGQFFETFGARPLLGHTYDSTASRVGQPPVIVLSHRLWKQISGDSAIIGTMLSLDARRYEVIGVMRPDFAYPRGFFAFWHPLVLDSTKVGPSRRAQLIARFTGLVRTGVTPAQLALALRNEAARWHTAYPSVYERGGHQLVAQSLTDYTAGPLKPVVLALFGAVGLMVLIACANVASLQMVRAAGRSREMAVRAALGAGRAAITRHIAAETSILAVGGGLLGVSLAVLSVRGMSRLTFARFAILRDVRIDVTALGWSLMMLLTAGLFFAAVALVRARAVDINATLRDAGRGVTTGIARHRLLRASVVLQVASTLVLLMGSALLLRSLDNLLSINPGFAPDHALSFRVQLPASRYTSSAQRIAYFDALNDQLNATAGIAAAGFVGGVPFGGAMNSSPYTISSVPALPGEPERHANLVVVYGNYFAAAGIPVVRGRAFSRTDYASDAMSAVIDESLSRQSFPNAEPLGATIGQGRPGSIVGVVHTIKHQQLEELDKPTIYWDYAHFAWMGFLTGVVRTSLSAEAAAAAIHHASERIDASVPLYDFKTLEDRVSESLGGRKLAMYAVTAFGAISLVLAVLGIYAVMSYIMAQRSRELGIRMALGAQRQQVLRMALGDGWRFAILGLAAGGAVVGVAGRVLQTLLYGVGIFDGRSLATSVTLIGSATLAACYLPARRAVMVDPVQTLRGD